MAGFQWMASFHVRKEPLKECEVVLYFLNVQVNAPHHVPHEADFPYRSPAIVSKAYNRAVQLLHLTRDAISALHTADSNI